MMKFDQTKPLDIIPIGRATIDLNPTDVHKPLNESANFNKYVGGSPANIAVGLARLGKKVGFIGKVSDDQFGTYVIDYFKNDGINTDHIYRAKNGENLGLTFTEIKSPTESSILMYRNNVADLELDPSEIDEDYIKSAKGIVVSGTALAKSPSREACFKAIAFAKKNGTKVIFDIDYRKYTWKSKDEISIYYSLVGKQSDIIIGSEEEFELMEHIMNPEDKSDKAVANRWFDYGNEIVVIKHGKEGSEAFVKEDNTSYKIKPFPVKLLKSFGGGDAYGSALIYALLEGWEVIDALEFGSASAAMLVASHSCSADMPSVEAIKDFIKKEKEEYGEMIARY